jgi:UDP:flavonoid glycosyltransferase YjiC (YdhE family)
MRQWKIFAAGSTRAADGTWLVQQRERMAQMLLIPVGSAGDVHPFIALALALRERGHRVTVITSVYFESLIRKAGLDFVGLGTVEEFESVLLHPDGWHPRRGFPVVFRWGVLPWIRRLYDIIAERYIPGETVVAASLLAFGARLAQEKLGVPTVSVELQPAVLRSCRQAPVLPGFAMPDWLPSPLKRLAYWLGDVLVLDPVIAPETNAVRAELGLPPVRRLLDAWWHSPDRIIGLYPAWFAPPQPDWPSQLVLTGFPLFDERGLTDAPREVHEFLDQGPPLIFTAGSAMRQGHAFFAESAEACRLLGRRGLLVTRYAEQLPATLPEGVRHCAYIPFSQLLPRSAALVHHGGIGTTAQALAAGVPQLVMPMSHDQPDNAARVMRLGVGRSLAPQRFQARAVARLLDDLLTSPDVPIRCAEVARHFHGAEPIADACRTIAELLSRQGQTHGSRMPSPPVPGARSSS